MSLILFTWWKRGWIVNMADPHNYFILIHFLLKLLILNTVIQQRLRLDTHFAHDTSCRLLLILLLCILQKTLLVLSFLVILWFILCPILRMTYVLYCCAFNILFLLNWRRLLKLLSLHIDYFLMANITHLD